MLNPNCYAGPGARHYDSAYAADSRLSDIPFYLDVAQRIGARTLEVGCGTGRVLLPIARAGVAIDGLDLSTELLGTVRSKLAHEPGRNTARLISSRSPLAAK